MLFLLRCYLLPLHSFLNAIVFAAFAERPGFVVLHYQSAFSERSLCPSFRSGQAELRRFSESSRCAVANILDL